MNKLALDDLLRRSLLEDIGFGDITSEAIFPEDHRSQGFLLAKQNLILAGMQVFVQVFALLDSQIQINPYYADGTAVPRGEKIASMAGNTRSLLAGERVALNLLQRMSGIATHTRRYVEAVNDFPAIVVDTRKTTPGLRMLEKYAVTVGGGRNHRYGLDSMVLIKDNHIQAAGGISTAVQRVRSQGAFFRKIEVEVENLQQVQEALSVGVDIIMLDNMHIQMIEQAVKMVDGKALVEVSGNVVLERISELAAAGVNIISSGELTHSVKTADISMRLS
ncbi:carboxylating nicotinate-nucleotide diphosphorylase [Pelosinus propionicus]|uniref:Probable nicotinate-nucleotide pyrophosphorylase [carboxylating] n=1 Tax=Pelosinus propionicus DSM 13327 TaxID=1123291 RepID=A0A1I4H0G3_9FIRM|nr:carboxylating nicotinate-nucleotide diphosphorylase [Pelosinus propionicus]SFL35097.1 nicotinate-nucleotide pyrophosphorylase [carboxylating] [Pelosinus propionicus DSM 13327]